MKKTMLFAIVLALPTMILIARTANAIKIDQETEKTEEAKSAFLEIVDLWYDQKFDELYARFAYKHGGKMSKEKFINRMAAEKKRLACCWQKVQ
ncbi:MAG: hypothetical protein HY265_00195, partial [Deltaproteobacteria bacterium]|nr:hypothetical protein [Deltaproteobacteria bacterium]